jgi:hypothetical protein
MSSTDLAGSRAGRRLGEGVYGSFASLSDLLQEINERIPGR